MTYREKVIICGDARVGKSSLLEQYVEGKFGEEYHQTIGEKFLIKAVNYDKVKDKLDLPNSLLKAIIEEKGFKLSFWDWNWQRDGLFSYEYYFAAAVGAMVVFDITNRQSFINMDFWISKIMELCGNIPYVIVGNKLDRSNEREVDLKIAMEKAKQLDVEYIETSAKTNYNTDEAFLSLASQVFQGIRTKRL